MNKLVFLRERFEHMGKHSGYDQLFPSLGNLKEFDCEVSNIWKKESSSNVLVRKMFEFYSSKFKGTPYYTFYSFRAEIRAFRKAYASKADLLHIAYFENNFALRNLYRRLRNTKVVATVHQPPGWWKSGMANPEMVSALDALIVLDQASADYFRNFMDGEKIFTIPHGVNTDFFVPGNAQQKRSRFYCVFSGHWLRDLDTLALVIEKTLSVNKEIYFDIIYPGKTDNHNLSLLRIAKHRQVNFRRGLSDEELRAVYQGASVLLMPLLDSSANNALLEAMACGIPVITTNTGGIASYIVDSFAFTCGYYETDKIVNEIELLFHNRPLAEEKGRLSRKHAEDHFSWNIIAGQVYSLYRQLLN